MADNMGQQIVILNQPGASGLIGAEAMLRLFGELGVATQDSDMSMSVRDDESGLEYAGAKKAKGLFPRAANLTNPAPVNEAIRSFLGGLPD